jgi:hypothetical protein
LRGFDGFKEAASGIVEVTAFSQVVLLSPQTVHLLDLSD